MSSAKPLDHTDPAVRRTFLGASDLPIILGHSPYTTPLQLFEEKLGRREHPPMNYAQYLGRNKEQEAREAYELQYGVIVNPAELIHPDHPWLVVHPDGLYYRQNPVLVEFKYMGKAAFAELVKSPLVPEMHRDQVQCQLMVAIATGLTTAVLDYVAYDGMHMHVIRVQPLPDYSFFLASLRAFWERVERDDPPPFDPERDVELHDDSAWWAASMAYKQARKNLDTAEADLARAKKGLLALTSARRASGNGVTLTRFERKGQIELASVPELKGIDALEAYLDQFRAPPTTIEKVSVEKEPA